jgi:hypothetical protein
MIYFIGKAQTNLINWAFFVLNVVNFGFMVKGDNKPSTNMHSVQIAKTIKMYSAFILIVDIMFICFIGEREKPNQTQSIDQ